MLLWIIGCNVIFGNVYVIITTIVILKKSKAMESSKFHQIIILNISIADFIMGIYLLTIASFDASFSGVYKEKDLKWRSSLNCSIIGSLAVISSETSCFLMVILTAFRLRNITKGFLGPLLLSKWKFCIIIAWIFSLFIGVIPLFEFTSQYFIHSFSFSIAQRNKTFNISTLNEFACRLASLSNSTTFVDENDFRSVETF